MFKNNRQYLKWLQKNGEEQITKLNKLNLDQRSMYRKIYTMIGSGLVIGTVTVIALLMNY